MDESNVKKRRYWKGKLVSEAVYNKRLKQSEKNIKIYYNASIKNFAFSITNKFSFPYKDINILIIIIVITIILIIY